MTPADHVCRFGPFRSARWGGGPVRDCLEPFCRVISLDSDDDQTEDDQTEDRSQVTMTRPKINGADLVDYVAAFTRGTLTALLWADLLEDGPDGEGEPIEHGSGEFDPEPWLALVGPEEYLAELIEAAEFVAGWADELVAAAQVWGDGPMAGPRGMLSTAERAGHNFHLSRNGHGAGWWDCGLPDELGEKLHKASQRYGERHAYHGIGANGLPAVVIE